MSADHTAEVLATFRPEVRQLAMDVCAYVRELVPDASEEADPSAKLVGFTFIPGTYRGLFVAVAPQKSYVNLMFSKGAELSALDSAALLEGTGKKARHVKIRGAERLAEPTLRALIEEAARRTPRT